MQVSSTSNSSPANIALSLQSTGGRGNVDRTVTAVGPRANPQEYVAPQRTPAPQQRISLDPVTEKKLSRIQEVQVAFKAALNIADTIESQYLLEPII